MPSFNQVVLLGNLTRSPELRQLPGGSAVAEFGMASNRKFKGANGEDREEVTFVDCAAFGKQAEVINQYCTKGKPLFIVGRLRYDSWDDKNGGGKRSKLSVVVENFQFLGGKEGGQPPGDDEQPFGGRGQGEGGGGGRPRDDRGVPRGNWAGPNLPQRSAGANFKHPPRQPNPPPQQPFGDQIEFKEADIPF